MVTQLRTAKATIGKPPPGLNRDSLADSIEILDRKLLDSNIDLTADLPPGRRYRGSVQKIFVARQELVNLWEQTRADQQDSYVGPNGRGRRAWNNTFQFVADIHSDPHVFPEGAELRYQMLTGAFSLGRNLALRVQLALCDARDISVPKEPKLYRDNGQIRSRAFQDKNVRVAYMKDIDGIIITRIPKKLVCSTGHNLVDESQFKGDPLALRKEILSRRVRDELKNLIKNAVPLDEKLDRPDFDKTNGKKPDYRILLIQARCSDEKPNEPSNFGTLWCLRKADPPGDKSSWKKLLGNTDKMKIQFFTSAYDLYRAECHITEGGSKEITQLANLTVKVTNINSRIDREFKFKDLRDELETDLKTTIRQVTGFLRGCKVVEKKAAEELLSQATSLRDRLNRANSAPAAVRTASGRDHLLKREEDIKRIDDYIYGDAQNLLTKIQRHEAIFKEFRLAVANSENVVNKYANLFDTTVTFSPRDLAERKSEFLAALKIHPEDLDGICMRPFTTFADKLRENYTLLEEAVDKRDNEGVVKALIAMNIICKYNATAVACANIKMHMTEDADKPQLSPFKLSQYLKDLIGAHEIFRTDRVWSYDRAYQELKAFVAELQEHLERIGNDANDYLDERKTKSLREHMKTPDPEIEAAKLVRIADDESLRPPRT